MMLTLTLVDVRRIQNYLFNANELKQCLGGSMLVERATHDWIIDGLPKKCNVRMEAYQVIFDDGKKIEQDDLDAEAIFLGGGNAAILFKSLPEAKAFARRYSRKLLQEAPGIEAAIAHVEFDWDQKEGLKKAWEKMQKEEMPRQKGGRATSQPLLGLSVTAECAFTGLPAVGTIVEKEPKEPDAMPRDKLVSAEALIKHNEKTVEAAKTRLQKLIPLDPSYTYPEKFDELGGEKGHSSYIAVVHADGNSMGKRIKNHCQHEDNREMVNKMREFSQKINGISISAMQAVVKWLQGHIHNNKIMDAQYDDAITIKDNKLPLRPIIFGGDDVTFVCEGRLGIVLARKYLEEINKQSMQDEQKVFACAGIAIVPGNYPFSRAYDMAENLAQAAKKKAREADKEHAAISLMHWHISTTGLALDWETTKTREFQDGNLLLRPLVVNHGDGVNVDKWRTWQAFHAQVQYFRNKEKWKLGRSKLKELRETLRNGAYATQKFTEINGELPDLGVSDMEEARKSGWRGDSPCIYFDALEADDWMILPKEV